MKIKLKTLKRVIREAAGVGKFQEIVDALVAADIEIQDVAGHTIYLAFDDDGEGEEGEYTDDRYYLLVDVGTVLNSLGFDPPVGQQHSRSGGVPTTYTRGYETVTWEYGYKDEGPTLDWDDTIVSGG